MEDNQIIKILQQIRDELSLLTGQLKIEAQNRFFKDFLTTDQRKAIYNLFDGKRDAAEIAKIVNCSLRNVQIFIKELEDKDLIEIRHEGRTKIPMKAAHKIALYYASQDLNNKDVLEESID